MRAPTLISPHYLVLLALAGEMGHGLAIQRRIISDTTGIYLKPSMLYAAMKTLEADQQIETAYQERGRTVYRLTNKGRRRLRLAAGTLGQTARLAQDRLPS